MSDRARSIGDDQLETIRNSNCPSRSNSSRGTAPLAARSVTGIMRWWGMANGMYWCGRCMGNHRYNSQIGRDHLSSSSRSRTASRTPALQRHASMRSSSPPRQVGPLQRPPAPSRNAELRRRSREVLLKRTGNAVSTTLVGVIFNADSVYGLIADEVLARVPWYRRRFRSHWLCLSLEDASEAASPTIYLALVQEVMIREFVSLGMPKFLAQVLAKSAGAVVKRMVGALGADQLVSLLRALILLICPNFDRCPTQQSVCSQFVKPGAEEVVRSILTP